MRRQARDEEESVAHDRRERLSRAREGDLVTAIDSQWRACRANAGHCTHDRRIHLRQDFHVRENSIQLRRDGRDRDGIDAESRERGNVSNLRFRDGH